MCTVALIASCIAGVPNLLAPDLSILGTDFLTPIENVIDGVTDQVTALTNGLGTLDCLAGLHGNPTAGEPPSDVSEGSK